jgi:hypothetical protein
LAEKKAAEERLKKAEEAKKTKAAAEARAKAEADRVSNEMATLDKTSTRYK